MTTSWVGMNTGVGRVGGEEEGEEEEEERRKEPKAESQPCE